MALEAVFRPVDLFAYGARVDDAAVVMLVLEVPLDSPDNLPAEGAQVPAVLCRDGVVTDQVVQIARRRRSRVRSAMINSSRA